MKVIVVDDEKVARTRLIRFLEENSGIEVVAECNDGATAIEKIRYHKPDLVFLDIQMPGMSGFDVVTALQFDEKIPVFVFVTAYDHYAVRAFEIAAVDYVLKPYNKDRIHKAVQRAADLSDQKSAQEIARSLSEAIKSLSTSGKKLTLKTENRMVVLNHDEIDWIEATGHHVRVHAGSKSYLCRMALSDIAQQLPEPTFQRIHRSYIVNVNKIREIHPLFHGDCLLILTNQAQVYMSRSYTDKVKALLGSR